MLDSFPPSTSLSKKTDLLAGTAFFFVRTEQSVIYNSLFIKQGKDTKLFFLF